MHVIHLFKFRSIVCARIVPQECDGQSLPYSTSDIDDPRGVDNDSVALGIEINWVEVRRSWWLEQGLGMASGLRPVQNAVTCRK
jgi:hypothetical protein